MTTRIGFAPAGGEEFIRGETANCAEFDRVLSMAKVRHLTEVGPDNQAEFQRRVLAMGGTIRVFVSKGAA